MQYNDFDDHLIWRDNDGPPSFELDSLAWGMMLLCVAVIVIGVVAWALEPASPEALKTDKETCACV